MNRTRLTVLVFLVLAMLAVPFPGTGEDAAPTEPMYGDPACKVCKGTGVVTPQTAKKGRSKFKQYVMYCYYKAQGKRCDVLIGGWEPCQTCADLPSMAQLLRDHEGTVASLRDNGDRFRILTDEFGMNYNYLEGVHFALATNVTHGQTHGIIEAVEKAWDIFAQDWGLLTAEYLAKQPIAFEEIEADDEANMSGVYWDNSWRSSKRAIILFDSHEQYLKFIDWYWDHGGGGHDMGGKELLKKCAAFGVSGRVPTGRATYMRGDTETQCSLVHNCGHEFLSQQGYNRIPHWIDEGFAKYMEVRVKNVTLTHCIEYGGGNKADETWQDSSTWKALLKQTAAVKESKWDEAGKRWIGLIPFETLMRYKTTNISWQGMAQAWGLVTYLMGEGLKDSDRRRYVEKFKELMIGIGGTKNRDPEEQAQVIKDVYNMSADELYESWRQWILKKW